MRLAAIHFISHGSALGKYEGRTASGPSGSVNHDGILRSMPGRAMGTAVSALIMPALPNEAPPGGGKGSMTTTSRPERRRYSAVDRPTTPAPMTMIAVSASAIVFPSIHSEHI